MPDSIGAASPLPPKARAALKCRPEDFVVDEELGFEPSGSGEHLLILVRKRRLTTDQVQHRLARWAGVAPRNVSFSGIKDRQAVTSQWFSIQLPGRADPELGLLPGDGLELLRHGRHHRKLRRGTHIGNRFRLLLRQVSGDRADLEQRLHRVAWDGAPNYFGDQRFGRGGGNLQRALTADADRGDRRVRGYTLSAARAWLFNAVLERRVATGTWDKLMVGDLAMLAGSASHFQVTSLTGELERRCAAADIHPSGPMWGAGAPGTAGKVLELECEVAAAWPELVDLISRAGLHQERRSLRVMPRDLCWRWPDQDSMELEFALPRGAYATTLVGQLVDCDEEMMEQGSE